MASMAASLIGPMTASLIQHVASSMINALSGKGVMREKKGQEVEFLPLSILPLMTKAMSEKGVTRAKRI